MSSSAGSIIDGVCSTEDEDMLFAARVLGVYDLDSLASGPTLKEAAFAPERLPRDLVAFLRRVRRLCEEIGVTAIKKENLGLVIIHWECEREKDRDDD